MCITLLPGPGPGSERQVPAPHKLVPQPRMTDIETQKTATCYLRDQSFPSSPAGHPCPGLDTPRCPLRLRPQLHPHSLGRAGPDRVRLRPQTEVPRHPAPCVPLARGSGAASPGRVGQQHTPGWVPAAPEGRWAELRRPGAPVPHLQRGHPPLFTGLLWGEMQPASCGGQTDHSSRPGRPSPCLSTNVTGHPEGPLLVCHGQGPGGSGNLDEKLGAATRGVER